MNQNQDNRFGFNDSSLNSSNLYNDGLQNSTLDSQQFNNNGYNQQNNFNNNSGITPVNHQYDNINQNRNKVDNRLVRKLMRPRNMGFSNTKFIILTILLSLVVGIGIGVIIMK